MPACVPAGVPDADRRTGAGSDAAADQAGDGAARAAGSDGIPPLSIQLQLGEPIVRQAVLLVATFGVTIAVLSAGFLVLQSAGGPGPSQSAEATLPLATLDPTQAATTQAAPTRPAASVALVPGHTASPLATRSPAPTGVAPATGAPQPTRSPSPAPSMDPAGRIDVVVRGTDYVSADVPSNGTLTRAANGVLTMTTTRLISAQLEVEWELPPDAIPPGYTLQQLDVKVCGTGNGDFWETYGPEGSEPVEHEATPPDRDGCWSYRGALGPDTKVIAIVRLGTTMVIQRIEFAATVSR